MQAPSKYRDRIPKNLPGKHSGKGPDGTVVGDSSKMHTLTQRSTLGRSGALATTLCVVSSDRAISYNTDALL